MTHFVLIPTILGDFRDQGSGGLVDWGQWQCKRRCENLRLVWMWKLWNGPEWDKIMRNVIIWESSRMWKFSKGKKMENSWMSQNMNILEWLRIYQKNVLAPNCQVHKVFCEQRFSERNMGSLTNSLGNPLSTLSQGPTHL